MRDHVLPNSPRRPGPAVEAGTDLTRYRKRRRVALRHETAAVVAEIRRMRRTHGTDTSGEISPRLAG